VRRIDSGRREPLPFPPVCFLELPSGAIVGLHLVGLVEAKHHDGMLASDLRALRAYLKPFCAVAPAVEDPALDTAPKS